MKQICSESDHNGSDGGIKDVDLLYVRVREIFGISRFFFT